MTSTSVVYWDTSALVAIYAEDAASDRAETWWTRGHLPACAWLGFAETLAALAARARHGQLAAGLHRQAVHRFEDDWQGFRKIQIGPKLAPELRRIIRQHTLRGADAVHLAAALLLNRHLAVTEERLVFACHDRALAIAAEEEGLALAWMP